MRRTGLNPVIAVCAAAVMFSVVTATASATVSFGGPTNFAADDSPRAVAIGDFNVDTKPDLAVANAATESSNISILLGDGSGGFSAPTNFAVGGLTPVSVAVADFNGDSNPDLAVANNAPNNVATLLGNGSGGFSAPTNFPVGNAPRSVSTGDFNGDSSADLAVANTLSDNVSILLGNGSGGFTGPTNFAAGDGAASVAVGNFNGDTQLDLAVVNNASDNVSILFGNGGGGFSAPTNFAAGSDPIEVAVGDFNGDLNPDLAVANFSSGNVAILLGNGSGGFTGPTSFAVASETFTVAVADLNGDSKPDLAAANFHAQNVSILLGNGSGAFTAGGNFGVGTRPIWVAAGDLNGDSAPDLAVANFVDRNVSILLNEPVADEPGYPRPQGATPLRASLVVAYEPCVAPNRTHGPPLPFSSCAIPVQSSEYLTVGTPDANSRPARLIGSVRYDVISGDPGTLADEADVALTVRVPDVRRQGALTDYTGELMVLMFSSSSGAPLRWTDRLNGTPSAGTVVDTSFPATVGCAATADPDIGSTCSLSTTLDALTPGVVPEGKRSIWQLGQVEVQDGGADGFAETDDNTVFLRQGVFVP